MSATPIVPGLMYQVRYRHISRVVFARNPIDALCKVLDDLREAA